MKTQILFLQGAGTEAYDEDARLAESLREALGPDYEVIYPRMPGDNNLTYEKWRNRLAGEFLALGDDVIVVGHSFGGSVCLKYLSEGDVQNDIHGLFLLAMPFWRAADWDVDEYALREDVAENLPDTPIYLYHCQDDDIVPVSHLGLYADMIPNAKIREFDSGGHQFNEDLSAIANDILQLEEAEV